MWAQSPIPKSDIVQLGSEPKERDPAFRIVNGRPPPECSVALYWVGSKLDNVALLGIGDWPTQESRAFCFFHFVHLAAIV